MPTTWTTSVNVGDVISASLINELRTAINAEIARRNTFPPFPGYPIPLPTAIAPGDPINSSTWTTIKTAVTTIGGSLPTMSTAPGAVIYAADIISLRVEINTQEAVCLCNCLHGCPCNCLYGCTCNCLDCNHCPDCVFG